MADATEVLVVVVFGKVTTLSEYQKDSKNPFNITATEPLPGRQTVIPNFMVYLQMSNIKISILNYRMSRACINIEYAFGILSSRFQLLK